MRALALALVAIVLTAAPRALADEPVSSKEPRLLQETGENTTVIDAFDEDDPFDANLLLGFHQQFKNANIRRESNLQQPGLETGGFTPGNENVAHYTQSRSILDLGADIGLFRDLALSLRLPLILSDSRELSDLDGSSQNPQRLQDSNGDQLFSVPFKSPTRSGIDWFSVALNYAIYNQQRDDTKPTWVIGAETRIGIGARIHACNDAAAIKCPDPANRNGPGRDPGISRGTTAYILRTIFSRRFGYVEPYTGLEGQYEVPQSNSDMGQTSNVKGALLENPPIVGTVTIGTEIYPYENREEFQRVSLDFKLQGSYHSPGREYTELFDALGSSRARSLTSANPGQYHLGPDGTSSVADPNASNVYFTGVTDQQAFSSFGGFAGVTWQTGQYVKFNAGVGLTHAQSHLISSADACNPDNTTDPGASGPCRTGGATASSSTVTGIANPNHRPSIDLPGHRFSVDDTTLVDLWLSGAVMF